MLIVNNVANVSTKIFDRLKNKQKRVEFYQPVTNANTKNKLMILISRLCLPAIYSWKLRKHNSIYIHYALFATFLKWSDKDLIVHCHGTDIRENLHNRFSKLTINSLKKSKLIFVATPDLLELFPSELTHKITFIPNPVDTEMFCPIEKKISEQSLSVLFLSKLDKTKGVDKFIPLIEFCCSQETVKSVYAFKHGNETPPKLPKHEKIIWLDKLPYSEMVQLIQVQDIAIGQMELGALGMSELESMSCGIPTIAYFKYNHMYKEPSPILNVDTTENAKKAILRLVQNSNIRQEYSKNSRHWIERFHNLDRICDQIEQVFVENNIHY